MYTTTDETTKRNLTVFVILLTALLTLPFLGLGHFYTRGEPREALVAMAMLDQGNFILPFFQGEFAFKPPMLHWLVSLFSLPAGHVSELSARIPSALAYIVMCTCFFRFLANRCDKWKAFIATLILITAFEVHRAAMTCRVDMVLTTFTVCAFMAVYRWEERKCKGLPWVAALLVSGAILTKGPVGCILPCFIMAVSLACKRQSLGTIVMAIVKLALLSSILPLCWYIAAYGIGGDRFLDLVMEENFGRFLGKMSYESHENGPFYYIPILLSGLLPWSLLLLLGLFAIRLKKVRLSAKGILNRFLAADPLTRWAIVCAVCIFVFYEIPKSKRSVYLLPMYPAMALLMAEYLSLLLRKHMRIVKAYALTITVVGILFSILLIAAHWLDLSLLGDSRSGRRMASQLQQLQIAPMNVYYLLMALMPVIAAYFSWRIRKSVNVWLALSFTVWTACYFSLDGLLNPAIKNAVPDYAFARTVRSLQPNGDVRFFRTDGEETMYAIDFYLNNQVIDVTRVDELPAEGYVMMRRSSLDEFRQLTKGAEIETVAITDSEFTSFKGDAILVKGKFQKSRQDDL